MMRSRQRANGLRTNLGTRTGPRRCLAGQSLTGLSKPGRWEVDARMVESWAKMAGMFRDRGRL